MSKYLTFTEGTGWTVKKSGFYYFYTSVGHTYSTGDGGGIYTYFFINNTKYTFTKQWLDSLHSNSNIVGQQTVYLKENDVIDFSFEAEVVGQYSSAYFRICAMFE